MPARAEDSRWSALSSRDRRLSLVVPAILVVIAVFAVTQFHRERQSSWQGVGFGMFATYDNRVSRFTRITIEEDGASTRVDASDAFPGLLHRSEVTPLGPAPRELAESVRTVTDAAHVRVEIWGIDVDADEDFIVAIEPIRAVEVP